MAAYDWGLVVYDRDSGDNWSSDSQITSDGGYVRLQIYDAQWIVPGHVINYDIGYMSGGTGWITVSKEEVDGNSLMLDLYVEDNKTSSRRGATIRFYEYYSAEFYETTIDIYQNAGQPPSYTINPSSSSMPVYGGKTTHSLSSNVSGTWSISESYDWITCTLSGSSLTINAESQSYSSTSQPTRPTFNSVTSSLYFAAGGESKGFSVSITAGSSGTQGQSCSSRTGYVAVYQAGAHAGTITVTQAGYTADSLNSAYSTSWYVSSKPSWINISGSTATAVSNTASASTPSLSLSSSSTTVAQGGGSGSFTASNGGGTGSTGARDGNITITCSGANASKNIYVYQYGHSTSVSWGLSATSWISASRSGNTISWSVGANASSSSRTGYITVSWGSASKTFTITQSGASATTTAPVPGGNKILVRNDFNNYVRSYYSSDYNRALTYSEINGMTWTSGGYRYTVSLASSYASNQCVTCQDVRVTYNYA